MHALVTLSLGRAIPDPSTFGQPERAIPSVDSVITGVGLPVEGGYFTAVISLATTEGLEASIALRRGCGSASGPAAQVMPAVVCGELAIVGSDGAGVLRKRGGNSGAARRVNEEESCSHEGGT